MVKTPYFSIVIPTRNRPEFLKYCLLSLKSQTFSDFEVIVSDNHTGKPCKEIFDEYADERFRYISPPKPLPMHDNWEFACQEASGEYVTVLIDKTIFKPKSLETAYNTLMEYPAEIISWRAENYLLENESKGIDRGFYYPTPLNNIQPKYFDPKEEIIRRFIFNERRGTEGAHYYFGKICFGAYKKILLNKIIKKAGRIFFPLSPDYTSMLSALTLSENAVDTGQSLIIQFISNDSNGQNCALYPSTTLPLIMEIDPSGKIIESLPIKGLYSSQHNIVAGDYIRMQRILNNSFPSIKLNKVNLYIQATADLLQVIWKNDEERQLQYQKLSSCYSHFSSDQHQIISSTLDTYKKSRKNKKIALINILKQIHIEQFIPETMKEPIFKKFFTLYYKYDSGIKVRYESIIDAAKISDDC